MTVIVKHNKTNSITDWTQAQLDEQIALGNFPSGTTLANIVLPSDWNNDHTLTGLGTMAEQDATAVAITGGTINNTTIGATTATTGRFTSVTTPSVTATTNDLTLSAISTGNFNVNTPNGTAFKVLPVGAASSNWLQVGNPSTTVIRLGPAGTTVADFRILAPTFTNFYTGSSADGLNDGANQMRVSHTASAVNYVQATGGATGSGATISTQGSDGNAFLALSSKGVSALRLQTGGSSQVLVTNTSSPVNQASFTGSIAGLAIPYSVTGSDTNISMAFQPKGTGAIDLAAGSSGVNISNGGTVTAITRTATGSGYTTKPTCTVSAPTTAGGVQAIVDFPMAVSGVTVASGGTGYTVGNVLSIVGGTLATGSAATITVATVSSGVITSVTLTTAGVYSTLPTNPVSVTGGSGSSATFNLTWLVSAGVAFTITNAGSGYIEQPTITFSGGGGSGAAAYATVGNSVRLQSLGTTSEVAFAFRGASGINSSTAPDILRLLDTATANDAGIFIQNSGFSRAQIQAYGNANANLLLGANGSGRVSFTTSGTSLVEQMRVAHTASAVNYVQVTGSATGANPVISSQGSDTNIGLRSYSKGAVGLSFWTNGGASRQFQVEHTAGTIVNYATATGSATGAAPAFSVAGSNTDIDLALTPKGTGLIRFGTYVAGALLATGYINIKAADGTTYKVLVST
jgi:hypothetical protein